MFCTSCGQVIREPGKTRAERFAMYDDKKCRQCVLAEWNTEALAKEQADNEAWEQYLQEEHNRQRDNLISFTAEGESDEN